nr:MAG TPA: hypothetical protein [Caudoviricetes sp.]
MKGNVLILVHGNNEFECYRTLQGAFFNAFL